MKKILWIFLMLVITIACNRTNEKQNQMQTPPVEEKTETKDVSALKYKMFKAEKATPVEVARKFKDFLEGEGMYYPKYLDFHQAAQIDEMEFDMRPTILVIFGNPKEMGVLINENQEAAIDLPFRILIYQDTDGQVWVMYKDFKAFKKQYFLSDPQQITDKYDQLLDKFKVKLKEWETNKTAI